MKRFATIWIIFLVGSLPLFAQPTSDTLTFTGQLSGWANYNGDIELPIWMGGRYVPQANYLIKMPKNTFDMELSINMFGSIGTHPFDTVHSEGKIKPYRAWGRYSTNQFELRLGLQKINFGSAAMLRPLMWFDQIDPRDPLQLTDGVWGLLARYYFLNNSNLWVWALYGNKDLKTWETLSTDQSMPELGGRFQMPVQKGEAALSYHFRKVDTLGLEIHSNTNALSESRIGVDGKWDIEVGVWLEGVWINKNRNIGMLTNQIILNSGIDYTFGIGNGVNVVFEQLVLTFDEKPWAFDNTITFSGLSATYPLGLTTNLQTILYYDWTNRSVYSFANFRKQMGNVSIHLMGYWNPKEYLMPLQESSGNIFAGKGLQVMAVFTH